MTQKVTMVTDGSNYPSNPGMGGWAAILECGGKYLASSGWVEYATNNNMESMAVVHGLKLLKRACEVHIYTDSMYVIHGIRAIQKHKMLKTNVEVWNEMEKLLKQHTVVLHKVAGHTGDPLNEWADRLAGTAVRKQVTTNERMDSIPEAPERHQVRSHKTKERLVSRL